LPTVDGQMMVGDRIAGYETVAPYRPATLQVHSCALR
jgi:hypothetical protein